MVDSNVCYFHPYLVKWSNFTNIFQLGGSTTNSFFFPVENSANPTGWKLKTHPVFLVSSGPSSRYDPDRFDVAWVP